MDNLHSHWAPQLRANGAGDPSFVARRLKTPTTRTLSFLDLPRELRHEIYIHLVPEALSFTMPNQCRERVYYYKGMQTEKYPLNHYLASNPVLFLNRQIRHEMLDSIYANTTFRFDWRRRASFILQVVQAIPASAKAKIRHLSWRDWSLHTGGDRKGYNHWPSVMAYIATHFTSLRTIDWCFPSGEDRRHHYHNWQVPRLAAQMLADGIIEKLTWRRGKKLPGHIGFPNPMLHWEEEVSMALTLLSIPLDVDVDEFKGFEFRRLLQHESHLDKSDPVDRWALECLRRERYDFDVTVYPHDLVLTRK
ncbi:hypothetical protein P171DRAFT_425716 [Karstenula rhodostoma CBS 690.94]|uniref:F-box domain-containing protein n=1 Tax=Karstenula rhodostoma CBS 690.94 TaxID=1392251 RepID=A0A9P4PTR0_9PLEO|nr:hypothetical protein P171DRAFT_425716 [Karstenula rhodostoma CBS 690.94]